MNNNLLILIFLLSLAGLAGVLTWKIRENRKKNVDYSQFGDYSIAHLMIDYAAFRLVYFCKEMLAKVSIFFVFFVKNSLSVFRYLIIRVEKRFAEITESLKNRERVHKSGPVSSFLQEIKEYKETAIAEAQNNGVFPEAEESTGVEKS